MNTRIAVLPTDVLDSLVVKLNSNDADVTQEHLRFLRLPHPRTTILSLFLPYKQSGKSSILEVQAVSPPNERSWFMPEGEIIEDGQMLVFTPVDPAFLLVPFLRLIQSEDGSLGNFRPMDDIFDDIRAKISQSDSESNDTVDATLLNDLSRLFSLDCTRSAMRRVCEAKDITPEISVYRYSSPKFLEYLKSKVERLRRPDTFEISRTLVRNLAKDGLMEDGKEALLQAGRLKAACELVSQYLSKNLYEELLSSYDFTALDAYQEELRNGHASAAAANMSAIEAKESKSSVNEVAENGKKRKGPVKGSHGVEKLKKANTKGMSKLSSFFQKAS